MGVSFISILFNLFYHVVYKPHKHGINRNPSYLNLKVSTGVFKHTLCEYPKMMDGLRFKASGF